MSHLGRELVGVLNRSMRQPAKQEAIAGVYLQHAARPKQVHAVHLLHPFLLCPNQVTCQGFQKLVGHLVTTSVATSAQFVNCCTHVKV